MALWSLTQERVEKLLKQIGDKEMEIDALIQLSPKDLWTRDLDAFIQEWHDQLDDEAKQARKIANMGRRASAKLRIGAGGPKSKKRKADDSDAFSDSDFGSRKTKKAVSKPKTGGLLSYLEKNNSPPPKSASQALKEGAASNSTAAKPPVDSSAMTKDGASDVVTKEDVKPPAPSKKPRAATTKARKPSPVSIPSDDEDDEDDVFAAAAKEAKETKRAAPARQARAAAKKVPKYTLSDDSDDDNGNDLLGDVSTMVKGIGANTSGTSNNRPLFSESTSARPGSGHRPNSATSLAAKIPARPVARPIVDISDDETDYTKLMPQPSPQRPAPRNANDTMLGSDDDDAFGFGVPKATSKVTAKAVAKPAAKPISKTASKAAAKPAPKPKASASTVVAKKATQLSPAAKAYAAKLSKAKPVGTKTAPIDSDEDMDDDEEDVSALANDILSDEEDETMAEPEPAPRAAARPGRRAAAAKPKYQIPSDDESEDDVSEASFDDDSD